MLILIFYNYNVGEGRVLERIHFFKYRLSKEKDMESAGSAINSDNSEVNIME